MVKKLFKHEMLSYIRIWLPMNLILLGIAILGRIVRFFENDSTVYNIVNISSITIYVIGIIAAVGITLVLGIIRFYKNLFSGEGYLTFTLPVTSSQHIAVKTITAAAFQIFTLLSVLVSLAVMTAGDVLPEVIKAVNYLMKLIWGGVGFHLPLYITEAVLLVVLVTHVQLLFYYTCISIGQLFRKNRILAALGVYFGFYIITQILGTLAIIFVTLFSEMLDMEAVGRFIEQHQIGFIHGVFGIIALVALILGAIYFIVIRTIISRHLNLE